MAVVAQTKKEKKKRKRDAIRDAIKTKGKKKTPAFYCLIYGPNDTHDTEDCRAIKRGKKSFKKKDHRDIKDLNAFVNAKIKRALEKASTKKKKNNWLSRCHLNLALEERIMSFGVSSSL